MVNVPRGARRHRIQPTTVTTKSTPMTTASTGEDAAPRRAARPKITARKPAMTLTSRRRSSMRVAPSGVGTIELRYESLHVLGRRADELVCERAERGADDRADHVDPEVRPRAGRERRPERAGGVHRRAGDRAAEERVEADSPADGDRRSGADRAGIGRNSDDHEHQERGQDDLVDESSAGRD